MSNEEWKVVLGLKRPKIGQHGLHLVFHPAFMSKEGASGVVLPAEHYDFSWQQQSLILPANVADSYMIGDPTKCPIDGPVQ